MNAMNDRQIEALDRAARRIDTGPDGQRIAWRTWGHGPKLILLHGNGGSWLHWFRNIPALAEQFEVIAPDIPGFGDSDLPPPPYRTRELANLMLRDIGAVIGTAGPVCVAGFSMGGGIATEIAAALGPRVRHLVLIGAGRGFGVPSAPRPNLHSWRRLTDADARRHAHRHNLNALMLGPDAPDRDLAEQLHVRGNEASRARFEPEDDGSRLHGLLCTLHGRITAIWGEEDAPMQGHRQERVDYFGAAGADFVFLAGVGHWAQFEKPDTVNAVIRARFREITGGSAAI